MSDRAEVHLEGRAVVTIVWEAREYRDHAITKQATAASPEDALRDAGLDVPEGLDAAVAGLLGTGVLDTSQVAIPESLLVIDYGSKTTQAFWRVPTDHGKSHVSEGKTIVKAVAHAAELERMRQRAGWLQAAERAKHDARRWTEKADALDRRTT